jgi:hypothetical protein
MNTQALKQLRRVVKAAPADRFHMRRWIEKAKCGTAHCAAGWAAQDQWFIKQRFPLKKDCTLRQSCEISGSTNPTYEFEALAKFFDLEQSDSDNLFGDGLCPDGDPHVVTKEQVIANIDQLLKGDCATRYVNNVRSPYY